MNCSFKSQEACTALGMISENFPMVGEALQVSSVIEMDNVSEWCNSAALKKNSKPHCIVDFQALSHYATHETHCIQCPFYQACSIFSDKKRTLLDSWNRHHSIPLHPHGPHLTTFILGCLYWDKYAPHDYTASGNHYLKQFEEIVSCIPNKTKCIDDILLLIM